MYSMPMATCSSASCRTGRLTRCGGIALAPGNFGTFNGKLLIGNFGDGTIHAFDPNTGALIDQLTNTDGTPLVQRGLWGMQFGNDLNA